jgi:putative SOS response-associated peptidase YedK
MCGRFRLTTPEELIADAFGVTDASGLAPRYNIAPSQRVATVRPAASGSRTVAWSTWGVFRPTVSDEAAETANGLLINARSETAAKKPIFREAFRTARCLIPADGFYEWRRAGSRREPFHIQLHDGQPFAFAGLWLPAEATAQDACVILTTDANALVARIHDRMPVILRRQDYARWLDPGNQDRTALEALLRPYAAAQMTASAVGQFVNDARNEGPRCLEPERQRSLFG